MSNRSWVARARLDSPLGPLTAVATRRGLAGLWFDRQAHRPVTAGVPHDPANPVLVRTTRALAAYWRGTGKRPLPQVPLDPAGTAFQRAVWRALRAIPAGETRSYGDIARRIGRPAAARAVGAAVGRNPVGILVPCHRVVGKDGSLTGYAGGLSRKQALLAHEGALPRSRR